MPLRHKRKRKTSAEEQLDNRISELWYKHAVGVQIDVMDIGNVFNDAKAVHAAGGDIEESVLHSITKYRKN